MKKILPVFFLLFVSFSSKGTTYIVTTSGFTFVPASIQILAGDTVDFNSIGGSHTVLEVSQATWNANQSTPLPGGFSLGFGGGYLFTGGLSQGMHYYVCQPHAGSGMKGTIEVIGTVGIDAMAGELPGIAAYPNPFGTALTIEAPGTDRLEIYNLAGARIQTLVPPVDGRPVEISTGFLPRGMYFFRFFREGSLVEVRRLVRN